LPEPIEITLEAPPCARPDMLPYRHPRQRRVLRISHRSLSNGMIVALAESLDNNAVDDIYASGNCMLESGLRSLVHSQTGTTRLTVLDISRNVLEKFLPPIAGAGTGVETSVIGGTRGTSETSRGTNETSETRATTSETRAKTKGTGTNGRTLTCHPRNAGTQALHDFFHATHATNVLSTDLARRLRGNRGGYPACPLIVVNLSSMKLGDVRGAYLGKAFTVQVLHPQCNGLIACFGFSLFPASCSGLVQCNAAVKTLGPQQQPLVHQNRASVVALSGKVPTATVYATLGNI